jgi:hypothetical protein
MPQIILCVLLLTFAHHLSAAEPPDFTVKLETVMKHDDGKFLWFHTRAAPVPGGVVMTIQKHLKVSDYYSGLHFMRREGVDGAWSGPLLPPEIDWQPQADGVTLSVADVTPGWHEKTGRLLAIGCRVRYSPKGKQLDDVKRAHQTVYAILDPKTSKWTPWQVLELPESEEFNFARNACAQWVVNSDGKLLVPLYIGKSAKDRFSTTVAECRFDGEKLIFERNGDVLRLDVARGLYEPSLVAFGGRYYLTLRNDERGYVSVSDDGLHFAEPKPWTFDDGAELGSYNTQQHWLAHSDGLFLVYTRRGANNDHIVRHRAPLFIARVDPEKLQIIRSSEKVVVPERGAELGNFGCARINDHESWVTVCEGMFMKDSKARGAEGATFVARILWSKPNTPSP